MNKSLNTLFTSLALILFTACTSLQITEESVSNQSVAGVTLSSKSSSAQAVLANAVVYFEYDEFTLTMKSIQALKEIQKASLENTNIFKPIMEASKFCSLGQMTDAMFDVGGEYRRNM